jgi:hypothetical protein
VGKVNVDPAECRKNNGRFGYTIRIPSDPEDIKIFVPTTREDEETRTPEWCIGGVAEVFAGVQDWPPKSVV